MAERTIDLRNSDALSLRCNVSGKQSIPSFIHAASMSSAPHKGTIMLNVRIMARTYMPRTTGDSHSPLPANPQRASVLSYTNSTMSTTQASMYQSLVYGRPHGSQASVASVSAMVSPLVRSRPPSVWKRLSCEQDTRSDDSQCVKFTVAIERHGSTVEDLVHIIESTYDALSRQDAGCVLPPVLECGMGAENPLIICTALFNGPTPLLFSSLVSSVLQSGDTVTVYNSITCDEDDEDSGDAIAATNTNGGCHDDVTCDGSSIGTSAGTSIGASIRTSINTSINVSTNDGTPPNSIAGGSNSSTSGEFLFVPLSALPPPNSHSGTTKFAPLMGPAGAANLSYSLISANTAIGQSLSPAHSQSKQPARLPDPLFLDTTSNINMSAVGSLVSQAPLKARFINVLIHPVLLRAFLEFCALPSELALESLLFVLDVERFRHVQPSMARLLANYIYLSYIAPYAPLRINVSRQMRDRIPWPFLPGWEYNPWVFDEMLASVGFTLKKHTLLRFERSPVGLFALMGQEASGFNPEEYVRPLRLDLDYDPMVAIVAQFEPDIDVVVWVNDLNIDHSSSHIVTGLAQLTVGFREQLLMRVAAQFVNEHLAYSLCNSYFQLATRIRPLQKQRRIKKTRKIRNFFGDHPHEALLRQQLMAIVPPSSQRQAARAAAETVARKRCSEEAHRRRAKEPLNHKSSMSSSMLAEQKILAMDSDSDIEKEHMHGWAQLAMQKPPSSWSSLRRLAAQRERSWSDSDDDRSDGEWPRHGSAKRRCCRHHNSIGALSANACNKAYYNDQTLRRALSMIGASQLESLDGNSSDNGNNSSRECTFNSLAPSFLSVGLCGRLDGSSLGFECVDSSEISIDSIFSDSSQGVPTSIGQSSGGMVAASATSPSQVTSAIYERKRRVDKLLQFFGGSDPTRVLTRRQAMSNSFGSTVHSLSAGFDPAPTLVRAADVGASNVAAVVVATAALTAKQRNLLIRRRRKLKAILGEDSLAGHSQLSMPASNSHCTSARLVLQRNSSLKLHTSTGLITPDDTTISTSTVSSLKVSGRIRAGIPGQLLIDTGTFSDSESDANGMREACIRRFNKVREILGDSAPAPCPYTSSTGGNLLSLAPTPAPLPVPLMPSYIRYQAASPTASLSDVQRMRARWRRNKLMTVLGDVPTNVMTLYKADAYCSSDELVSPDPSSSCSSKDSSVFVLADSSMRSDIKVERDLARVHFDPATVAIGADAKTKQVKRRQAKKLRLFFGQSLGSDTVFMQGAMTLNINCRSHPLDTVAEVAEVTKSMSPVSLAPASPLSLSGSDKSYEFIPICSPASADTHTDITDNSEHKMTNIELSAVPPPTACIGTPGPNMLSASVSASASDSPMQLPSAVHVPIAEATTTATATVIPACLPILLANCEPSTIGTESSNGSSQDDLPRPVRAQFWMTDSPESQASVITNEKVGRRSSLMATLRASKASIVGSIKRATPSTSSLATQAMSALRETPATPQTRGQRPVLRSSGNIDVQPSFLRQRSSSTRGSDDRHNAAIASKFSIASANMSKRNSSLSLPPASILQRAPSAGAAASSPAPARLGFIARQISKVASASPITSKSSPPSMLSKSKSSSKANVLSSVETRTPFYHPRASPLVPPCRTSSVRPLPPLPPISPNNFQASFDRSMALREMIAVAEYISSGKSPENGHWKTCSPEFPPRTSSMDRTGLSGCINQAAGGDRLVHQDAVLSASLATAQMQHARSWAPQYNVEEQSAIRTANKTVHWFDSPKMNNTAIISANNSGSGSTDCKQNSQCPLINHSSCQFTNIPSVCAVPSAALLEVQFAAESQLPKSAPGSTTSSMDSGRMSIVLRSPSTKKLSVGSVISRMPPRNARVSANAGAVLNFIHPIPSLPPKQLAMSLCTQLSRMASITAVGRPCAHRDSAAGFLIPSGSNNIVTIRARRSQSLVIRRKSELATIGRKRSNTI
ncbi:hypothetical protein LPJ66_001238, partial [Kickxella alabastrina]